MASARALRFSGCGRGWRPPLQCGAQLRRASFVDLPPIAAADPSTMNMRHLISHMREGAVRWRIEHQPFWAAAFGRLRELAEEVDLQDAACLLAVFQHLRQVDLELVEYCELLLMQAGDEDLLGVRQAELIDMIEALGNMQRPAAMTPAFRPLVARAHRMDARQLARLLRAAGRAGCDGVADLTDTAARSFVERGAISAGALADFLEAASALAAQGHCQTGPRSGLALLVQHASRRAREEPDGFDPHLECLLQSAQAMGLSAPVLERLLQEAVAAKASEE